MNISKYADELLNLCKLIPLKRDKNDTIFQPTVCFRKERKKTVEKLKSVSDENKSVWFHDR